MTDEQMTDEEMTEKFEIEPETGEGRFIIQVGGKELDLREAYPLSNGDHKRLKKKGINLAHALKKENVDIDSLTNMALIIFTKIDKSVTMNMIDELSANGREMRQMFVIMAEIEKEALEKPDIPFSDTSTTSEKSTDGPKKK